MAVPNEILRAWQQKLIDRYVGGDLPSPLPKFGADGLGGQETHDALIKFQALHHLPQTGQFDEATRAELNPKGPSMNTTIFNGLPATIADYVLNFATSKINGVAIALVVLAVGWINTRFGFTVPEDVQNLVTGWLVAGGGALIVLLRTFFNKPKVIAGATVVVQK